MHNLTKRNRDIHVCMVRHGSFWKCRFWFLITCVLRYVPQTITMSLVLKSTMYYLPLANGRTAADFEADWGSADALGATATATATNTNRGAEEGGREVLGQNGPSADQDQR